MYGFGWHNRSPWHRLREMERQMNRLFGEFSRPSAAGFPPMNVHTDSDGATLTAELPGMDPKELDITVQDHTVTVRGERKAPETGENAGWLRRERTYGRFARSIDLPFTVDPDSVEAHYRDGVLEIKFERHAAEKPRQIAVQS